MFLLVIATRFAGRGCDPRVPCLQIRVSPVDLCLWSALGFGDHGRSLMHGSEYFNVRFWQDESVWPRDDINHIFLARAIRTIDAHIHTEPLVHPPEVRPDMEEEEQDRLEDEREKYEDDLMGRRREAVSRFVEAFRKGSFKCFTRPKKEEQFSELPEPLWFSEKCDHWFHFCDFYLVDDDIGWSDDRPWIFVSRDGFETCFGRSSIETNLPLIVDHYSPYMRLMIEVVRDLKINPQNQLKAEDIEKEFLSRWNSSSKHERKLTKSLAAKMATLVREPSSQVGGNKKPKKGSKTG
jgi:hypothetical protein